MKPLFIPVKSKIEINKLTILKELKILPKNIAIVYSSQYEIQAKEIKNLLSSLHNFTKFTQILGCSKPVFPKSTQAVLLISDGRFHAVSLAYESNLPVYIYEGSKLNKISERETDVLRKNQKTAYLKYLNAERIGILVSTKPGQQNLEKAIELKHQLKAKGKNSYILIGDNINSEEFENFSDIQSWVNTACPRLDLTSTNMINIKELKL